MYVAPIAIRWYKIILLPKLGKQLMVQPKIKSYNLGCLRISLLYATMAAN